MVIFRADTPLNKDTILQVTHTALKNISSPILPNYLDLDLITISYCISRHNFTSCLQAIYPLLSISCLYHSNCLFYTIYLSLSSCVFLPQPTLPVSLTPSIQRIPFPANCLLVIKTSLLSSYEYQ
jgi:hypothetical protein